MDGSPRPTKLARYLESRYFKYLSTDILWLMFAIMYLVNGPPLRNVPAGIAFVMALMVGLPAYSPIYKFSEELDRMLRVASLAMATVGIVLMAYGFWFR